MKLWLCLRFRQLPLQCLNRSEQQAVVVLAGQRVIRANDCAMALGIAEGMGAATLRALAGNEPVMLLERDEQAEQQCLQQLCCWAYSISPSLNSWRKDCLQLEIGGCLNLFKGLDAILAEVRSGLGSRGFQAQLGLATTPKAAWLLSFTDQATALAVDRTLDDRLAPLPLNLLEDFAPAVDSLRRAGLETLGDVLALPSHALARRCGNEFNQFLQQALGRGDDPQTDYQPPATFSDEYWYGYEVKANSELMPAVQLLLQSLCRFLRNTQLQTAEILWRLADVDRRITEIPVRSASLHSDWENWLQLTGLRFEQLQLATGVEGLTLECHQLEAGELASIDLFNPGNQREPLHSLLDRLRNRLGLQAIEKIACRDEHLPELAMYSGSDPESSPGRGQACAQRPFWLMPQPQLLKSRGSQLYWQGNGQCGPLQLVYGPERIEDNWWRQAVSRDYYIARNNSGQHYWVFHDRLARAWYIHGVFP